MRGMIRSLEQPGIYLAKAKADITIGGKNYARNQVFEFSGDPARLTGLADVGLFDSVRIEHGARFDRPEPPFLGGITWLSPFSQSDGYGALAEEAVLTLMKQHVDVAAANMGWVDTYNVSPLISAKLKEAIKMYNVSLLMTPPDDGMVTLRNPLNEFAFNDIFKPQYRILYTMFETDTLPHGWGQRINNGVDAVFVPSKFMLESFRKGGVEIPIYHTPTGIDTQLYKPSPRQRARWAGTPKDEQVRFLLCGTLTRRKNVAGAVDAFIEAAGDNENWSLVIKTQPGHPEFDEFVAKPIKKANDPRIKLINERYSREQMLALYHISDVFVWSSFGEGIGLPPQEAMSCGLEVVAGRHSGALDFLDPNINYAVAADVEKALEFKSMHLDTDWGDVGNWWRPRQAEFVSQLKAAAAAVGKKARGPKARDWMIANRNQDVTGNSILEALNTHIVPLIKDRPRSV